MNSLLLLNMLHACVFVFFVVLSTGASIVCVLCMCVCVYVYICVCVCVCV